jgi:MFS transporter, LAT3 family, solute carrier family 43, member 3
MTNASSLLSALLFTGIIFGWAPLKLILLREGQYQELCVFDSSDNSNTSNTAAVQDDTVGNNKIPCVQQLDRFNRIFTLAQFALSFCSLPVGFFLDHTPSITFHYAIAAVFEVSGLILFGLSESSSIDSSGIKGGIQVGDYFCLAYSCMAIGGCMTMLGAFPASFLLPRHQPAILAAISCLFDASSVVFAIFNRLNIMNLPFMFSRRGLFMAYAIVALFIYSLLSYCWASIEKHDWKSIVEAEQSSHQTASSISTQQQQQGFVESANHHHQDPNGAAKGSDASGDDKAGRDSDDSHLLHCRRRGMHEWSLSQQWQTFEFVLVLVFASVHMLRCNFYIETVNEILASIASVTVAKSDGGGGVDEDDDAAAVVYANIFSFVLPVGIIFVPLIETTVRRLGIVQTLHLTNVLGVVFGALLLVPSLHVQAFNFFVFTCFRAYLYATLNTFIALTFVRCNVSIPILIPFFCIFTHTAFLFYYIRRVYQPWVA